MKYYTALIVNLQVLSKEFTIMMRRSGKLRRTLFEGLRTKLSSKMDKTSITRICGAV
jgi:hypothetical protein